MRANKLRKIAVTLAMCLAMGGFAACNPGAKTPTGTVERPSGPVEINDHTLQNLAGVDALGRKIEPIDGTNGKTVGMFYFVWHGQHGRYPEPLDISKVLENNPAAVFDKDYIGSDSVTGALHYWAEPLYGYYDSTDEWVIRKHMEMLAFAGVDYIALDATNADTYDAVWMVIARVMQEMSDDGMDHPKLVFYTHNTNTPAYTKVQHLYEIFYSRKLYPDSWYMKDGKPVIISLSEQLKEYVPEMLDYFYIRESQFHNEHYKADGVPWIDFNTPPRLHNGTVSISVAQNNTGGRFSDAYYFDNRYLAKGRGWNSEDGYDYPDEKNYSGANFQEQWDQAIDLGATEAFILGWNQWSAQKYPEGDYVYYADEFNLEYSTDIEPMKGGYEDNYYMQLVQNIRRFKASGTSYPGVKTVKTIDMDGGFEQWEDVPGYLDMKKDSISRNCTASYEAIYEDYSDRNDITTVKIAHDSDNLYVYAECADDIIEEKTFDENFSADLLPKQDENWMNLYIGTEETVKDFGGFGYLVNRKPQGDGTTSLERIGKDFKPDSLGTAEYRVSGKTIVYKIPRALLGLGSGTEIPQLTVKVADCLQDQNDVMDFYFSGDCAPIGRLGYSYGGLSNGRRKI